MIALRGADGATRYDFAKERFEIVGADGTTSAVDPRERPEAFRELVWRWETLKLASDEAQLRREARSDLD